MHGTSTKGEVAIATDERVAYKSHVALIGIVTVASLTESDIEIALAASHRSGHTSASSVPPDHPLIRHTAAR